MKQGLENRVTDFELVLSIEETQHGKLCRYEPFQTSFLEEIQSEEERVYAEMERQAKYLEVYTRLYLFLSNFLVLILHFEKLDMFLGIRVHDVACNAGDAAKTVLGGSDDLFDGIVTREMIGGIEKLYGSH
ncbi:hypothetical protein K1719_012093 [Acacia pycnantha]|nr:hypothetical protein K1719_012093 [Acacia pycnantha]